MLTELSIRNFAIIDSAQIRFGPGLNALTGETGAGKSILIDALGAVLGDRVSPEMVRTGAKSASIDATFELDRDSGYTELLRVLDELQIEPEDDVLILSREVQSGGRSGARINGRPTTASILTQVGAMLVDVHGQSDHLSLLRSAAQLDLLDRYAQTTHLRSSFAEKLGQLRAVRAALADARTGARDRVQRLDLLRYQIDEIERANVRVGEEDELGPERARLANADRLSQDAAAVYLALSGGDDEVVNAAVPSLRHAARVLDEMASLDPQITTMRERLNDVLFSLEDFAIDVRNYRDIVEADPDRLEAVVERLDTLRQLKRKYGPDESAILSHAQSAARELAALTDSDMDEESLSAHEESLAREAGALASDLSRQRQRAATALARDVEQVISELNMGSAEFALSIDRAEDRRGIPSPGANGQTAFFAADTTGIDKVTFLVAPNAGEGLKPLSRIASGGETARLMLALKSILSDVDNTPTLIFDEIDVGVGGRSGQVVGEKLWRLSDTHQVIAITHLPQIAAFADRHFRIVKETRDSRLVSTVELLDDSEKVVETAAMLDGLPVTATSRQSAEEMIRRAEGLKAGGERSQSAV